jgi:NADPH-dependent 2,4-dienoyl-CoA reductase/sulfur reductase-like enzyme
MADTIDVAIVGAGPYGLATAAHLRARSGLETRIFGEPMSFWRGMPSKMLLRSPYAACNIGAPPGMSLEDWRVQHGLPLEIPVPLERFLEYGAWFQQQIAPDIDRRGVSAITNGAGYRLTLADGDEVRAKRVVVAAGIGNFAHIPQVFAGLSADRVVHSSELRDTDAFAGKRIAVVGGGQSALEGAALLREGGADVELIVRESRLRFLSLRMQHHLGLASRMLYAWPDVGPAGVSHLVANPTLWQRLPRRLQDRLGPRCVRAAGAGWLVPRMDGIRVATGRVVSSVQTADESVWLRLDDGPVHEYDLVVLGTGYQVDVARYPFFGQALLDRISSVRGYPRLTRHFETSSPGLHIVGAPAAWAFGPLMRFVAGSDFASRRVAAGIARD